MSPKPTGELPYSSYIAYRGNDASRLADPPTVRPFLSRARSGKRGPRNVSLVQAGQMGRAVRGSRPRAAPPSSDQPLRGIVGPERRAEKRRGAADHHRE